MINDKVRSVGLGIGHRVFYDKKWYTVTSICSCTYSSRHHLYEECTLCPGYMTLQSDSGIVVPLSCYGRCGEFGFDDVEAPHNVCGPLDELINSL